MRTSGFTWLLLLWSVSACQKAPVEALLPGTIGVPPSLQSAAETAAPRIVRLDSAQRRVLQVQTVPVAYRHATYTVSIPGEVYPAPGRMAQVATPIDGRVVRLHVHDGEWVEAGQVLLELESLSFAELVSAFLQAQAEETYLKRQVARLRQLVAEQLTPQSTLDQTEADYLRAQARRQAAAVRLRALGITPEAAQQWGQHERPLLPLRAPIDGYVDQHQVELGQAVRAHQTLMTLVNPTRVHIRGFLSPDDALGLQPGDSVTLVLEVPDSLTLQAEVHTINPALDPENRAVVVNILADTRQGWPRPGQSVRLWIRLRTPRPVYIVPLEALTYDGQQAIVFVQQAPGAYEVRPVTVWRTDARQALLLEGVRAGEVVAVHPVFSLKALMRYAEFAEE
ncbi:efflux RND transporter periplasmic adaptor subunit [Rhodothermus profundi]|uniref:Membrane fusion protein, cobalt-zinc-cadmium efflux system n=1 Tax=Rhodothermus profundi TaxID=633813 RepID=A0A1M6UJS5_9BACT|nr:efflux RND transporter periplasmic adaptor subunit [Rhodothermus profundi]SHK69419.1 membrane fusion protein, cobalt-zinc-cadmium efflux system [Rhodothermus profundi]